MITRLYIDNYKGFVDFEWRCGPIALLMGGNGSGKSSLFEVLHRLAMVISEGDLSSVFDSDTRFRFAPRDRQQFELDVLLEGLTYQYQLAVEWTRDGKPVTAGESLTIDGAVRFVFSNGSLRAGSTEVKLNPERTAASFAARNWKHPDLERFMDWANGLSLLRLVPSSVRPDTTRQSATRLYADGSNFAAWYEAQANGDTLALLEFLRHMEAAIPGVRTINLRSLPKGKHIEVQFAGGVTFSLDELSDGQIALLVLYAVLQFEVRRGHCVALDEPDNFLALSEIEPLLAEFEDAVAEHGGQVFIISHHPEIYNRWARDSERCHFFERGSDGRFSSRRIDWAKFPELSPAELIARGWQDA